MAAKDEHYRLSVAKALYRIDPELILFGLAGSELLKLGKKWGYAVPMKYFQIVPINRMEH